MPERGIKHMHRLNELGTDKAGLLWRGRGASERFGVRSRKTGENGARMGGGVQGTPHPHLLAMLPGLSWMLWTVSTRSGDPSAAACLLTASCAFLSQCFGWKSAGTIPLAFGPGAVFRTNTSSGGIVAFQSLSLPVFASPAVPPALPPLRARILFPSFSL